ncbi:PREDICTED: hepatitis A virus cellular receptor 1 homolog [Gavialis gangeticus]|uniref:hepatitis A virus cellular receptor 1 homolog n=1 Tax=Gavialis gangeticus TaxID=94835 RepID=UPI00092E6A1D|nr:PREDICTED: hepatitis A virus cellular receptor 1 homolog [Gavialis gangeticus]
MNLVQEKSASIGSRFVTLCPFFLLKWILTVLFAGVSVLGSPVKGVVGQDVTLSCRYSVRIDSDLTTMCWGRGPCPASQCSDLILWTNGRRVTQRQDNRYQLYGNLLRGDVSLTIRKAREADAGTYCCRVEIHGWFNDQKTNVDVVIETASTTISTAGLSTHSSKDTSGASTASGILSTSASAWPSTVSSFLNASASLPPSSVAYSSKRREYIRMGIGASVLVILVVAMGIFEWYIHCRRRRRKLASPVSFSSSGQGEVQFVVEHGIHQRENIYSISCFSVSGSPVRGVVGQDVTLSCRYSVRTDSDLTTMCWGRGPCPASQCSDLILWTNGRRVTQRQDNRYQLYGNLLRGDVSLTIRKAREADAGTYCCRVEIHGWFNDQKTNVDIVIERASTTTSTTGPSTHSTERTSVASNASESSSTISLTWLWVSSSEVPPDNTSSVVHQTMGADPSKDGIYIGIGIFLVFLVVLAVAFFLLKRHLPKRQKLRNLVSSVSFSRTGHEGIRNALESDFHAEENVYTIH